MKLANRIGAAVLATAMVGTLLTGCGGGSASTTASTGDGTAAASSTESSGDGDNTYTMFMRSTYVDWIKELKWYDVAEERTGIHVDYISGPEEFNDVYSEIDQRVISGDLPDAVMTKLAQTNVYGPQGVFADLAPYIEKYAPNLQKYIDDNPDYKALVTDKDGHIYGLCKETPIFADLIGYRVDQFKAAGIDPDSIVTIDDFIPQIYLKDDAIKTIQQVLKNVVITDGGSGTTFKNVVLDGVTLNQQNLKAAAIFIAMLPIICVYPFVQKYFKKGILIGSVKG